MDAIRQMVIEPEKNNFKTSFLGLNKKQVIDYIAGLEESNKAAIANYDKNNEEQSASLSMALREKEKLSAKVSELEEQVRSLNPENDETKSKLMAENAKLKSEIEALSGYKIEIDELKKELGTVRTNCDFLRSQTEQYESTIKEKEDEIMDQCRQISEMQKKHRLELATMTAEVDSKTEILKLNVKNLKEYLGKADDILNTI